MSATAGAGEQKGGEQEHPPSPQQQAMLDRGDCSSVLIAAAGSGKTRVLTWLYRDAHLGAGVPLERLLAITFTDKAAGELRRRIGELLRTEQPDQPPMMARAWVGTFHSTCTRILREFAHHRGLDPAFGVIDELTATVLRSEAWDTAAASVLGAAGSEESRLLAQLGFAKVRPQLTSWWEGRRSAGEVHPRLPEPYPEGEDGVEAITAAVAELRAAVRALAAHADGEIAARGKSTVTLDRALDVADATLETADQIEAALAAAVERDNRTDFAVRSRKLIDGTRKPTRHAPFNQGLGCELVDAVHAARVGVCARADEWAAQPVGRLLRQLVEAFSERYAELKRESEVLDFDDLELEALTLLRENPAVRAQLVKRFERIYVDEFQDTNPRQFELVGLLAGDRPWATRAGEGDRPAVIVVGDPRQAIYGFRHADVRLIGEANAAMPPAGQMELAVNYRSKEDVLTAIDDAFGRLSEEHNRVTAGRSDAASQPGDAPCVELLVTHEHASDSWKEQALTADGTGKAAIAEMRLVAHRIGQLREADPGCEIAVLARTRTILGAAAAALADAGIAAVRDSADGFWQRLEVGDVLAWLALVHSDADDEACVRVFAGPLAGLSTDGVVGIGALRGRRGSGDPDEATAPLTRIRRIALACAEGRTFAGEDRERIAALIALLDSQRELGRAGDPAGLIDELLELTRYDEHVAMLADGARGAANLVRLRRLAAETAAAGAGLVDLLERVESEQREGIEAPEAAIAGEGAVRLMTIHVAKGLEFDNVFVVGLGSRGKGASAGVVADERRLGLCLPLSPGAKPSELYAYGELTAEQQDRELEEQMRVFYVATTRAKNRLVLSGCVTETIKGGLSLHDPAVMRSAASRRQAKVGAADPPIRWLGPAFVPNLEDAVNSGVEELMSGHVHVRVSRPSGGLLPAAARAPQRDELPVHRLPVAAAPAPHIAAGAALRGLSRLSYSALSLHEACALRFHVGNVLGLPATPDDAAGPGEVAAAPAVPAAPRAAEVGTLVHAVLERLPLPAEHAERRAITAAVGRDLGLQLDAEPAVRARIDAMIDAACDSPLLASLWGDGAPRRELPFTVGLGPDVLLSGVIDAWATLGDGSALVVDYKTDNVGADRDVELHTSERYRLQRLAYGLAALHAGAGRVRVAHIFLSAPGAPVAEVSFAAGDAGMLTGELLAVAGSIGTDPDPAPTRAPHRYLCDGCPARDGWCGWSRQATERRPGDPLPDAAQWAGVPARRP